MNENITNTPIRLDQVVFLSTLQLIVPEKSNPDKIAAFGSGFLLRHKDRLWGITADHVVHLDDHDTQNDSGQRTGTDYIPQIITNIKCENELASINLPLGGFYYFTGYGFDENINTQKFKYTIDKILDGNVELEDEEIPINVRIPSLIDFAICELIEPLPVQIFSNKVVNENQEVVVDDKTPKICLNSDYITDFDTDKTYIVGGTVHNEIVNSTTLKRTNAIHGYLKFTEMRDREAVLKTPENPNIIDWKGLSGAPILDDEGLLAGMIIRGPVTDNKITAIPINRIIHAIDIIIQNEQINEDALSAPNNQ